MKEHTGRLDWNAFYQLSEIYTAPLNVIWFVFASAIAFQDYHYVDLVNITLCCLDVFLFDLAVNIADNYFDYRHGKDDHFLKHSNAVGRLHLPLSKVRHLTIIMYAVSAIPGLILVYRTGWQVLVMGVLGYIIGIGYTAGPRPLNATALCELVVSGFISQFIILVGVYVAVYGQDTVSAATLLATFLRCLPLTLLFFATQLANNTCDLAEDLVNGRHTLASYLGRARSFKLIKVLSVMGLAAPLVLTLAGLNNWFAGAVVLLALLAWKQMTVFFDHPDKQQTYILMVKAGSLYFTAYILLFTIAVLAQAWL